MLAPYAWITLDGEVVMQTYKAHERDSVLVREIEITVPMSIVTCQQKLDAWCGTRRATCKVEMAADRGMCDFSIRYDSHAPHSLLEIEVRGTMRRIDEDMTQITGQGRLARATYTSIGCLVLGFGLVGIVLPLLGNMPVIAVIVVGLVIGYLALVLSDYWSQLHRFIDDLRDMLVSA
jgi:hypothetical protein